jgi:nitroreductase
MVHKTEFHMSKMINPNHPILDLLRKRWSPRAFADRAVEPTKLQSLLEAARWAPSSSNEQPWSFIVATKDNAQEFDRLLACLFEKNQTWAKNAPVLMVSVAAKNFAQSGKPNRHYFHDVGLAVSQMIAQATALDLYVHQMAGFSPEKARETYHIPETHDPVAAIAIGYLGDPNSLPDDLRERELKATTRKPLNEFVFTGKWSASAPWT